MIISSIGDCVNKIRYRANVDKGEFDWNKMIVFPGRDLLLPTDRPLRGLHIHNVPGVFRSYRHLVVLRRWEAEQQREGDDGSKTIAVFSLLLAHRFSSNDNGTTIIS